MTLTQEELKQLLKEALALGEFLAGEERDPMGTDCLGCQHATAPHSLACRIRKAVSE